MRLWAKMMKEGHVQKDLTCERTGDTRTHRILSVLSEICMKWDLENPIWLESNIRDFQRTNKVRFCRDNFVENIEFDYLEFQVLEE